MTTLQLRELRDGDLIQSRLTQMIYLVTGNYGHHATAVQTVDVTHAAEWTLVARCRYPKGVHSERSRENVNHA